MVPLVYLNVGHNLPLEKDLKANISNYSGVNEDPYQIPISQNQTYNHQDRQNK